MLADLLSKREWDTTTQEPTLLLNPKVLEEFIDSWTLVRKLTFEGVPEFLPGKSPSHTFQYEVDLGLGRPIRACSTACLTKIILKGGDFGVSLVDHVGQGWGPVKDNPQSRSLENGHWPGNSNLDTDPRRDQSTVSQGSCLPCFILENLRYVIVALEVELFGPNPEVSRI